jgi:putative membrane protein
MKTKLLPLLFATTIIVAGCQSAYSAQVKEPAMSAKAQSPADLNDLEIAHVAYTADNIDIRYAEIALKKSANPEVRAFAETMVRDHTQVNELALALLKKLDAQPQDNFLSQALTTNSEEIVAKLNSLSDTEFDRYYAGNELAYHKAVNDLVENSFIPNIENAEVKELFEAGLGIFKAHEGHASMMVGKLGSQRGS